MLEGLIEGGYLRFILIFAVGIISAHIIQFVLKNYIKKIFDHTETDLDNKLLQLISKPVYYLVILTGLYLALKSLSALVAYDELLDGGFFIFVVIIGASLLNRILDLLVKRWLAVKGKFQKPPQLVNKILTGIIYLIALLMILDHFGVEITPLLGALGVGGLAVGLALQGTLSNVFSGLYLISDRLVEVGDFVELEGGLSGYVDDIGWRTTRIKTLPNNYVVVPNAKLAESTITNSSKPEKEMSVVIQCGVDYGSDLKKVENVTTDVATKIQKSVEGAVKDFKPFIRYHTFGDSNINFSIILRVQEPVAKYLVAHEFIKALKSRYDREKIEISWPVRKSFKMN